MGKVYLGIQSMENLLKSQSSKGFLFSFSFSFALIFLVLIPNIHLLQVLANLLVLPFTLVHEIFHFVTFAVFFPTLKFSLHFDLFTDKFPTLGTITLESLPVSWESLVIMLSGTLGVIFVSLGCFRSLKKQASNQCLVIQNFIIFGLLHDIPNLFPITPSLINAITDGYSISILLLRMGVPVYPSLPICTLFCNLTSIFVFASFFYLGSAVYYLGMSIKTRLSKFKAVEPSNEPSNTIT